MITRIMVAGALAAGMLTLAAPANAVPCGPAGSAQRAMAPPGVCAAPDAPAPDPDDPPQIAGPGPGVDPNSLQFPSYQQPTPPPPPVPLLPGHPEPLPPNHNPYYPAFPDAGFHATTVRN